MHTKSKEIILTSTALNIYLLVLSTQLDGEIGCITSSKCQKSGSVWEKYKYSRNRVVKMIRLSKEKFFNQLSATHNNFGK